MTKIIKTIAMTDQGLVDGPSIVRADHDGTGWYDVDRYTSDAHMVYLAVREYRVAGDITDFELVGACGNETITLAEANRVGLPINRIA